MEKALQQEKTRERVARHRALQKALHSESVTGEALQQDVTNYYPEGVIPGVMTKDQAERFPNIPLPFGPAYYKALAEQSDR